MKYCACFVCIVVTFTGLSANAEEGLSLPPIEHAATLRECGVCHLSFPPQMLPQRSWSKLMADLGNHFGEDASLPEATRTDIAAYLTGHAADVAATQHGKHFMRGIDAAETPLRITETPFWRRAHDEVSAARFTGGRVKTAAICVACHYAAAQGFFGEGEEE